MSPGQHDLRIFLYFLRFGVFSKKDPPTFPSLAGAQVFVGGGSVVLPYAFRLSGWLFVPLLLAVGVLMGRILRTGSWSTYWG